MDKFPWQDAENAQVAAGQEVVAEAAVTATDMELVLRRRAAEIAAWQVDPQPSSPKEPLVVFAVGKERWGIALRWVREVIAKPPLRAIPGTPRWVQGVTLYRGSIVALVDLKEFMDLPGPPVATPWVVLMQGKGAEFGLAVHALEGCFDVDLADLAQGRSGEALGLPSTRVALLGITADRLAVIDGASLLASPDLVVHQMAQ
jgi:chemotaxis signal transduction protein